MAKQTKQDKAVLLLTFNRSVIPFAKTQNLWPSHVQLHSNSAAPAVNHRPHQIWEMIAVVRLSHSFVLTQ